ncbi:MAG: hypothetical protein ACTH31_01110, partial [Pseudoclavibacter sp.]
MTPRGRAGDAELSRGGGERVASDDLEHVVPGGAALRGRRASPQRWWSARDAINEAGARSHRGDLRGAKLGLERAIAELEAGDPRPAVPVRGGADVDASTAGSGSDAENSPGDGPGDGPGDVTADITADTEGSRRDLLARALLNLATMHEYEGRLDDALSATDRALAAGAGAIELVGDTYGTRSVLVTGTTSRAQTLALLDRFGDALAELDRAGALAQHPDVIQNETPQQLALLRFSVHNARTVFLINLGRLREAGDEAQLAVRHAAANGDAALAGHVYTNLAAIAQRTGDAEASGFYLGLAERSHVETGDASARQLAAENLGWAAYDAGRLDEAHGAFERAVALADE